METALFTKVRTSVPSRASAQRTRPSVRGKFLFLGDKKIYVKGVTYGTFQPTPDGCEYHDLAKVEQDFAAMVIHGINAVRTYTVPPRWVLDIAQKHGLHVMVGISWEQHMAILDDRRRIAAIEQEVRRHIRECSGHPGILCYSVGNEIPASIVRWHGRRTVERFIKRLYDAAKEEDPEGLVTYVNYPSTEYLQLPFLDFYSFNVYLESQGPLQAYFARLQNLAGDRPLVMAELGLDSRRNGVDRQACVLDAQIHTTFASGCAGLFVFAWTDEWFRGGHQITDWDFGLTTRERERKPALSAVRDSFADVPFPIDVESPKISVAICVYNEEDHIGETLSALKKVDYPNFEVIVVDDGSDDSTAEIARQFDVRLISTENRGLSSARNTAMAAASGDIVAYLDGDAYPDPHWLRYLAHTFSTTSHVAVGGPNIHPPEDGLTAECIANSPGGPIHVLLSDSQAEHIPGCNLAFRRSALLRVGGFDPQFRVAGDDVDICWRLQEHGWTLGFSPAAVVWHHRRGTVRDYWRQQKGYGKAEAMLERKWPEKYNRMGHLEWKGRLYGSGLTRPLFVGPTRIYHGKWGMALFQSIYAPTLNLTSTIPMMPEWHLLILVLAALSGLSLLWTPLTLAVPLLALANGVALAQAMLSVANVRFNGNSCSIQYNLKRRTITLCLHLLQPLARLLGRTGRGLTPWRSRREFIFKLPHVRSYAFWSETWKSSEDVLRMLVSTLRSHNAIVASGGDFDKWDLEVSVGATGSIRLRMAVEEHGSGKQLIRFKQRCSGSTKRFVIIIVLLALAAVALTDDARVASAIIGFGALGIAFKGLLECGATSDLLTRSFQELNLGKRLS